MKEQELIRKIEKRVKIFQSRKTKGPSDDKRHDLVQPDEQKWMHSAHNKLMWSCTKIGSVFDRDPRTVSSCVQKEEAKRNQLTESVEVGSEASKDSLTEPIRDKSNGGQNKTEIVQEQQSKSQTDSTDICSASPDGVDVAQLRKWGIPAKKAPEILFEWLGFHKEGYHVKCQSFRNLEEDLKVRKIPFKEAEINLKAELWAKDLGLDNLLEDIKLRRTYRSWENMHNYRMFMKEMDIRNRPAMEARERHLTEIVDTLIHWKAEIEKAIPEDKINIIVNIRQDPLFESIMTHCYSISKVYEVVQIHKLQTDDTDRNEGLKQRALINLLLKKIDQTLIKKSYADEWCLNCTRKKRIETD